MATAATNQMESVALCEAIFWKDGISAATKLTGIGRLLGFDRPAIAENTTDSSADATTQQPAEMPKSARQKAGTNANAAAGKSTPQARRGSRREELLNLINSSSGLTRGDILERMGLKGNKSGEMSVSNALTALTSKNQVRRENGKYLPIATETETVQQGTRTEPAAAAA